MRKEGWEVPKQGGEGIRKMGRRARRGILSFGFKSLIAGIRASTEQMLQLVLLASQLGLQARCGEVNVSYKGRSKSLSSKVRR